MARGALTWKEVYNSLRLADFPSNGALSWECEANPENPLADIRESIAVAVAKAAMKSTAKQT